MPWYVVRFSDVFICTAEPIITAGVNPENRIMSVLISHPVSEGNGDLTLALFLSQSLNLTAGRYECLPDSTQAIQSQLSNFPSFWALVKFQSIFDSS